jgi:hypothetical protein
MKDDETSHHEAGGGNGKQERQPVAHCEAAVHQIPPYKKWND